MAKINKGEVIKKIIGGLRLDPAREQMPSEVIDKVMPVFNVNDTGESMVVHNEVLNDSDKSFVVPVGFEWELKNVHVDFTATATVGSRFIGIEIIDDNAVVIYRSITVIALTASNQMDLIFQGDNIGTGVLTLMSVAPLYNSRMKPGWTLRVLDTSAVDAAADDMLIHVSLQQFSDDSL